MRALITGAGGFVGRWLAGELLAAGDQVYGLERPGGSAPAPGVVPLPADIRDPAAVAQAVRAADPEAIFHLAGLSSAALQARNALLAANVEGTRHLLEAAGHLEHPARVLLAGTGYLYGECASGQPAPESAPARPIGLYAESKWRMECVAREICRPPVTLLIARAFNHTGPGQSPRFAVPSFARQIARAERARAAAVVRVGDLSPRRDFLDVRDVVRAYQLIMRHGTPGGVYNVASETARSLEEVLGMLAAQARVPVRVVPDPKRMRPADIQVNVGSAQALRARTGWRPLFDFAQTLGDTLDYWREQPAEMLLDEP